MKNKLYNITKEEIISLLTQQGLLLKDIYKKLGVSRGTFKKKLQEFKIDSTDYSDFRLNYDVFIFDSIDTEEKAYWLGFLYADGNVRSDSIHNNNTISLSLSFSDYDHLVKFKTFMKDTRSDSTIKVRERLAASGNKLKMATYNICNGHLRQSLIDLGCIPNKSNILKFPEETIFVKNNLIYDFIRGYVDGDGSLSRTKRDGRLYISIRGTLDFLNGIKKYFPQFTKVYSEIDTRTGKEQHKLACSSNKADEVAFKLYENSNIYLDRKFKKFATLCKLYNSEKSGKIGEG
jgi:hypothetical protein